MANRITTILDLDSKGFGKTLSTIRTDVASTEGFFGKLKVGAKGAFDSMKMYAGQFAIAGGAALATFGAKSVDASQDLALAAGAFSDATGLVVEDASRWMEVAGDLGISAETVKTGFAKLNRELADGSPTAERYGLELQHTADGAVDVNATMLEAIDTIGRIKDPTERAAAAQTLFGRSYTQMAELVMGDADKLSTALANVSDAKVISEEELTNARNLRDALDKLKDSVEDVTLTVGTALTPVISDAADALNTFIDASGKVSSVVEPINAKLGIGGGLVGTFQNIIKWTNPLNAGIDKFGDKVRDKVWGAIAGGEDTGKAFVGWLKEANTETTLASAEMAGAIEKTVEWASELVDLGDKTANTMSTIGAATAITEAQAKADEEATRKLEEHNRVMQDARNRINDLISAKANLVGGDIAVRQAQRDAADSLKELNDMIASGEASSSDLEGQTLDTTQAMLDAALAAADYKADQLEANGSTVDAQTQAFLYQEELKKLAWGLSDGPIKDALIGYIDLLNQIPAVKTTVISTVGGNVISTGTVGGFNTLGGRVAAKGAEGAIVNSPTVALIGEAGPEALVPLDTLPGNRPVSALNGASAGGPSNVVVQIDGKTLFRMMWDETERQTRNGWRPGPGVRRVMGG